MFGSAQLFSDHGLKAAEKLKDQLASETAPVGR